MISYISLGDMAKTMNLDADELRNILKQEEYSKYYKNKAGNEIVSSAFREAYRTAKNGEKSSPDGRQNEDRNAGVLEQETEEPETQEEQGDQEEQIRELKAEIDALREQLADKEKIIAEYAFKFAEIADKAQQTAMYEAQLKLLQAGKRKLLPSADGEHKSFFSWLFRR